LPNPLLPVTPHAASDIGMPFEAMGLFRDYRSRVSSKVLNCLPTGVVSLAVRRAL